MRDEAFASEAAFGPFEVESPRWRRALLLRILEPLVHRPPAGCWRSSCPGRRSPIVAGSKAVASCTRYFGTADHEPRVWRATARPSQRRTSRGKRHCGRTPRVGVPRIGLRIRRSRNGCRLLRRWPLSRHGRTMSPYVDVWNLAQANGEPSRRIPVRTGQAT